MLVSCIMGKKTCFIQFLSKNRTLNISDVFLPTRSFSLLFKFIQVDFKINVVMSHNNEVY